MLRTQSLLCLALLAACGGGYGTDVQNSGAPPAATIDATPSISFTPPVLNVTAGTSVTFSFGSVGHNVYFDAAAGAPADIPGTNANTSVTRTFPTAGTYVYNCHIHPGMRGSVVVAPAGTADSASSGY